MDKDQLKLFSELTIEYNFKLLIQFELNFIKLEKVVLTKIQIF